ncbi:hypothetical protein A1353_05505 [Methylomonas methanica]|uniref:Uncharacterized protein n=1 Tax=Methylomonas methanica TaxID=421 RepID=A0A177MTN8_METMH|nr:hypothetical protein [Methylomonas methanica]OAI09021.1 hypothetical protein A1353_05505 [Methylomonas methanica]
MTHTVSKIEAASHQLDWAIRLLIDYDVPIPAITLAGAAEEILGKALGDISAHERLVQTITESHDLGRVVVSQQHLNKARNWLKHWTPSKEPEYETFDLLNEAIQGIARGLSNLLKYNQSLPSEGPRFIRWIENMKDHKESSY